MKQVSGFTLIEMIIVVGVIGILSTMVFVIIDNPSGKANIKKTEHGIVQVVRAIEQYRASGYSRSEIVEELTTGNTVSVPFAEKVAGAIPYLVDERNKESSSADFCSSPNGIAYDFLKKLNKGSAVGLYNDTGAGTTMTVTSNTNRKVLCKSKSNNNNFAIAVKMDDGVWACGGYSGNSNPVKFFAVANSGTLHIDCSAAKSSFFDAEAEGYGEN